MPPVCRAVTALSFLLADITLSSILLFLLFSLGFLHLITKDCQDICWLLSLLYAFLCVLSGVCFVSRMFVSAVLPDSFLCTLHFPFPKVASMWLYFLFSAAPVWHSSLLCLLPFIGNLNGFNSNHNFAQGPAYPLKRWNYSLQLYYLRN